MSRIKGINDRPTLENKLLKPDITVWKGTKQREIIDKNQEKKLIVGKNLENQLRIEVTGYARSIIQESYQATNKDGSLFVTELNIVPAFEDEFKSFASEMTAYNSSGILSLCDRETIHTEFVETTDAFGNVYRQPVPGNKACPVAGTNQKCPKGCSLTGNFYFYILELLMAGSSQVCRLQTHAIEDNQAIADYLDSVKAEIGAIKQSPFVSEQTKSYIVYRLSRREISLSRPVIEEGKRTGKRFRKPDWIVAIELHPIWKNRYESLKQIQQLQQLPSYQIDPKLIQQVYGSGLLLAEAKDVPSQSLKEFKEKLAIAYKENSWTPEAFNEVLSAKFGKDKLDESWSQEDLNKLYSIVNAAF